MKEVLARLVRATLGRLVPLLFRTRVVGAENIPPGGALLAGNHVSYLDPVLLWCVSPRPVHFMAKRELFEHGITAWALPRFWSFPVSRGGVDRAAIMHATELLRSGELVGVFPEGTRREAGSSRLLGEAHGGAAFIALRAGAPVVPVAFIGTDRAMPRGARLPKLRRVEIRVGEPIDPAEVLPQGERKERVAALTERIMDGIAGLLEGAEEGIE